MKFYFLGKIFKQEEESRKDWIGRVLATKHFLEETFPDNEIRVYDSDTRAIFLYRRRG